MTPRLLFDENLAARLVDLLQLSLISRFVEHPDAGFLPLGARDG